MSSDSLFSEPADLANQTDTELFSALEGGQMAALGVLYDRYADVVYGLALKLLGNPQDAEDVTQDVFLTFLQSNAFDPSRGSLSGFLRTMTHSRSIDRLRRRGVWFRALNRWNRAFSDQAIQKTPFSQVLQNEQAEAVRQAMLQLSDDERQVLEIAYYEGQSQAAIAQKLNLPLGTVKSRSRQGLKKLKRVLHHWIK